MSFKQVRMDANARVNDILFRERLLQEELRVVKEKLLLQGKLEMDARVRLENDVAELRREAMELKRERDVVKEKWLVQGKLEMDARARLEHEVTELQREAMELKREREDLRSETIQLRQEREELNSENMELKRERVDAQRAWLHEKQVLEAEAVELRNEWQRVHSLLEQEGLLRQQDIARLSSLPKLGEEVVQWLGLAHTGGGANFVSVGAREERDASADEDGMGSGTLGADGLDVGSVGMISDSTGHSGLQDHSRSGLSEGWRGNIPSRLVALRAQKSVNGRSPPTSPGYRASYAPWAQQEGKGEVLWRGGTTSTVRPLVTPVRGSHTGTDSMKGVSPRAFQAASASAPVPISATGPVSASGLDEEPAVGADGNDTAGGGLGGEIGGRKEEDGGGEAGIAAGDWGGGDGESGDMATGLGDLVFTKEDVDLFSDMGQGMDSPMFGVRQAENEGADLGPLAPPTSEGSLGGRALLSGFCKAPTSPSRSEDVHLDDWSFSLPAEHPVTYRDTGGERMTDMLVPALPTSVHGGVGVGVGVPASEKGDLGIGEYMDTEMSHGDDAMAGGVAPVSLSLSLSLCLSLGLSLSVSLVRACALVLSLAHLLACSLALVHIARWPNPR